MAEETSSGFFLKVELHHVSETAVDVSNEKVADRHSRDTENDRQNYVDRGPGHDSAAHEIEHLQVEGREGDIPGHRREELNAATSR